MMDDLIELWEKAFPSPIGPWDDLWKLHEAGVGPKALGMAGTLDITIKNGRWTEQFRGERAYIVPVCRDGYWPTADDPPIDLLAFRISTPRSFWSYNGESILLGQFPLEYARHFGTPLFVFPSPLEWLKAGGRGIVIVDWKQHWEWILADITAIQISDKDFAARAVAGFQRPFSIPPIWAPT